MPCPPPHFSLISGIVQLFLFRSSFHGLSFARIEHLWPLANPPPSRFSSFFSHTTCRLLFSMTLFLDDHFPFCLTRCASLPFSLHIMLLRHLALLGDQPPFPKGTLRLTQNYSIFIFSLFFPLLKDFFQGPDPSISGKSPFFFPRPLLCAWNRR